MALSEVQLEAIELLSDGASINAVAKAIGRSRHALWLWRRESEEFRVALDAAMADRVALLRVESIASADKVRARLLRLALHAKSEGVQLRACESYLDRVGFVRVSASAKVEDASLLALLGLRRLVAEAGQEMTPEEVEGALDQVPPAELLASLRRRGVRMADAEEVG